MKIPTLGMAANKPIDLGSDLGDETKISVDVVSKMKRAPNAAWLQELEEINQRIQTKNAKLRRFLQDAEKEKKRLQHQLQAKEEALEKLQHNKLEVKSDASISCTFYDDDFMDFEKHTTGIGSKLLKKMRYQGKGLNINSQGIVNPIKMEELPHYARLGYVRIEVWE